MAAAFSAGAAAAVEEDVEFAGLMTSSQKQHTPLMALAAREYNIDRDMDAKRGTHDVEMERKMGGSVQDKK